MISRAERVLLVAAPAAAVAAVMLGLRIGAGGPVRAAVVYGAPQSGAAGPLAWQVVAFDEDRGIREPAAGLPLEVTASVDGTPTRWLGKTDDDGVAEVPLAVGPSVAMNVPREVRVEVRSGSAVLAAGDARLPAALPREPASSPWARFSRREGPVRLDVAVLGQRVATGFPAHLWVHATDAATGAPLAAVDVAPEPDSSFEPAAEHVQTDARGWAHVVATPVGHAVAVVLRARAADGRAGEWAGGLYVSPGAAQLAVNDLVPPGADLRIDVTVPTVQTTAYLEIDDARGRAWGAAVPVKAPPRELPRATVLAPPLPAGLYWVIAAGDPEGASLLGPGTLARPFFVAASDDAALTMGTDAQACAPPADPRAASRVVQTCLALAAAAPVPRWLALDGLAQHHAHDAEQRARGMRVALVAILLAVLLEAVLLLRAAGSARARMRAAASEEGVAPGGLVGRAGGVAVALLVALLGFALLAAFLARVG